MTDGTIQVLEAVDDPSVWLGWESGCAKLIKMTIRGIEDTINLKFNNLCTKHSFSLRMSIKIGEEEYVCNSEDVFFGHERSSSDTVLKKLHEALGIPEHQTAEMVYLLFYPYCERGWLNDRVEPLASRPPSPKPLPKRKCKTCGH